MAHSQVWILNLSQDHHDTTRQIPALLPHRSGPFHLNSVPHHPSSPQRSLAVSSHSQACPPGPPSIAGQPAGQLDLCFLPRSPPWSSSWLLIKTEGKPNQTKTLCLLKVVYQVCLEKEATFLFLKEDGSSKWYYLLFVCGSLKHATVHLFVSVKCVCLFQQHLKKPVSGYTFQFSLIDIKMLPPVPAVPYLMKKVLYLYIIF